MATAKLLSEQVKNLEEELQQKENRLKELRQKQKLQESKERTHRLIERGAITESLIDGAETLTNEQIKMFLIKTVQTEFARRILTQIKEQNPAEIVVKQTVPHVENGEDTGEKSEIERATPDGD